MIATRRLRLVPCEPRHFEAILTDQKRLGRMLGVTVYDGWFDFPGVADIETMRFLYKLLEADPGLLGWWTYLLIHAEDEALVGTGGYKGGPDEAGMVEIGYAIVPAYRGRGLATEAARGLIDNAFAHESVEKVDAHTLAERNASVRVLEKSGMEFAGAVADRDLGEVWRWSVRKASHRP